MQQGVFCKGRVYPTSYALLFTGNLWLHFRAFSTTIEYQVYTTRMTYYEERTQRGISRVDLASSLGVSNSVVSSYENGVHLPPYDILIRIALLFGASTDYLLGTGTNQTINVDGLSSTQIEAIALIVSELFEH